jgi:hypothetical protein
MRVELSTAVIQQAAIALYKSAGYRLVCQETVKALSNKTVGSGIRRYYLEKIFCDKSGSKMLFMVIGRFRDNDVVPIIYQRLRESARSLPDGLEYVESWIEPSMVKAGFVRETEAAAA